METPERVLTELKIGCSIDRSETSRHHIYEDKNRNEGDDEKSHGTEVINGDAGAHRTNTDVVIVHPSMLLGTF